MTLAGYFDDSGTHASSRVAAWGGLVGSVSDFTSLDVVWRALLDSPLEGKQPLSKFSLSQCIAGAREFESYNQAERDRIRNRFRHLLDDVDLAPIAYVVDAEAWNALLTPPMRRCLGDAQNMALNGCLEGVHAFSIGEDQDIALYFDAGQENPATRAVLTAFAMRASGFTERTSISFSSVAALPGLQAADMIVGEAYRYFLRRRNSTKPDAEAHFRDLIEHNGAVFMFFGAEEIQKWKQQAESVLSQVDRMFSP